MKRIALLVGSSLIAFLLVACGHNGQKKAEDQSQSQDMTQQQAAPAAEPAAPAAEPAAPASEPAANQ